jgi:hypothetical protein
MTSKDQFIANKTLAQWWASISNDDKFDQVMLHASAVAFENCPSAEQRDGVLKFKEILLTLSQPDSPTVAFSQPGLSHNLEPKSRTLKPKQNSK